MKKHLFIFLLLISSSSYAQEKGQLYKLKLDDKELVISQSQIDTTISVLKKRLLNAGYKNSMIAYNSSKKEFIIESENVIEEEFIKNWLVKPCEVFFYETYTAIELLSVLFGYPNHDIDLDKKKAFYTLLNTNDSIINNRWIANVGLIKASDTSEFNVLSKKLKPYIPEDCLFAYQPNQTLLGKPALAIYALRNNVWKLAINEILDHIKTDIGDRGEPLLTIFFNKIGAKKFETMTHKNRNKSIPIVIDGTVYSAPFVLSSIEGGNTQISGDFTTSEAKMLVNMLAGGYLPIRLSLSKQSAN